MFLFRRIIFFWCHFLMNLVVSFVWFYGLWSYDFMKNKQYFQFDLFKTLAVLEILCNCTIFWLKRDSVLSSLFTWWHFGAGNTVVFMTISDYYLLPMVKSPKSPPFFLSRMQRIQWTTAAVLLADSALTDQGLT